MMMMKSSTVAVVVVLLFAFFSAQTTMVLSEFDIVLPNGDEIVVKDKEGTKAEPYSCTKCSDICTRSIPPLCICADIYLTPPGPPPTCENPVIVPSIIWPTYSYCADFVECRKRSLTLTPSN